MENILKTNNLFKSYKDKIIVNKINMIVRKGEVYGLLGQDGAGKTSTIKMIIGQVIPDEGSIELFGETINSKSSEYKRRIGVLLEKQSFYPMLTARENLEVHRRYMGIQDKKRIDEILSLVKLNEINKSVDKFSTEMKQRLGLARALLNEPEFLILDEPIKGLDVSAVNDMLQIILEINKRKGVTVLICSNTLRDIQSLTNRIGIMHKGTLLKEVLSKDLQGKNKIYLQLKVSNQKKATVVLEKNCGINNYRIIKNNVILIFEKLDDVENINKIMVNNGIGISELKVHTEDIEDYFFRLTGEEKDV
ncbi:ABC transporter ATP-binding protein [Clostridium hydrogenum]|uniref:ABC transporter ATP-binding protein n=1 Tax=Clostridium hydrogenum TaxID=2855764 RepID=UPI001F35BB72|nr:ABC transporter ATP-binding protein [Clostridium hydrogenum]